MIKNRTTQLIFQTAYCTIGLIGCVACIMSDRGFGDKLFLHQIKAIMVRYPKGE